MAQIIALDPNAHQHLYINPNKAELHGATLNLIPVVLSEFSNIVVQYPIVLTKNGDTGAFVCAAMLGFEAGENLFWQNEQWQGLYLPLQLQRQPFFIGDASENPAKQAGDHIVCLDLDSPAVSQIPADSTANNEQQLFTTTGEETPYFQQAKQCLAQLIQGEMANEQLLLALKNYDLIQPLSLEITFVNQKSTRLNGLYTINQDKLAALSNDAISDLHQQQLLTPIYTMIASIGQLYALIARKNAGLTD